MRKKKMLDAMSMLDDDLIAEAAPKGHTRPRRAWITVAAAAACFAVVLGSFGIYRLVRALELDNLIEVGTKLTVCFSKSPSKVSHRSTLRAGELSALRQPFACLDASHPFSMASTTYLESLTMVTSQGSFNCSSAFNTAMSSMRLFVVWASPPNTHFSFPRYTKMAQKPPAPE